MVAGQGYSVTWSSTNATSASYSCTATGTGYTISSVLPTSGSMSGTALAAWVGNPSSCTWRVSGPGGDGNIVETMRTISAPVPETPPITPPASPAANMAAMTAIISILLDDGEGTTITPPVPEVPWDPVAHPIVIGDVPYLNNSDAGALPGAMSVGDGGVSYGLPIAMPPGIAGVMPSISLNYSSSNASGVAGLGWSISAVSNIDRCGRSFAVNGSTDTARFIASDRLCLDGAQLILVNGDSTDAAYWSDTAQYRTEIDNFSRIQAIRKDDRLTFQVQTKAGMTLTYDDRADAYLTGQGRSDGLAHRWWLTSSVDRSSNIIEYSYVNDTETGESRLPRVRWGGNTNAGTSHFAKADFSYEGRPDARSAYIHGSHFDERLRLKSIAASTDTLADGSGGTLAMTYSLGYRLSATSGRSLLDSVKACDAAGLCLPATSFAWGESNPAAQAAFASLGGVRQGPNLAALKAETIWYTKDAQRTIAIGDGKSDMIERFRTAQNNFQQRLYLSNSDGNGWTASTPMANIAGNATQIMEVGDFDGDGQIDLLVAD